MGRRIKKLRRPTGSRHIQKAEVVRDAAHQEGAAGSEPAASETVQPVRTPEVAPSVHHLGWGPAHDADPYAHTCSERCALEAFRVVPVLAVAFAEDQGAQRLFTRAMNRGGKLQGQTGAAFALAGWTDVFAWQELRACEHGSLWVVFGLAPGPNAAPESVVSALGVGIGWPCP